MLCCCVRGSSSSSRSSRGCARLKDAALITTCLISFVAAFAVAMTSIAHSGARNLAASVSILGSIILVPPIVVSLCISRFAPPSTRASERLDDEENAAAAQAHEFLELEQLRWTEFKEYSAGDVVVNHPQGLDCQTGGHAGRVNSPGYIRLGGGMQEVVILRMELLASSQESSVPVTDSSRIEELRREVVGLGSIRKCNVLPMLGFTLTREHLLLFMPKLRSLRDVLQSSNLGWGCRCRVAALTARGLARLHHGDGAPIVHGSISCESIQLLEDRGENSGSPTQCTVTPYIADTGLLKLSSMPIFRGESPAGPSLLPVKTIYAAPEADCGGAATTKSDVYSFGVLLYQLLSGNTCTVAESEMKPGSALKKKLTRLMDPKLERLYRSSEAEMIQQTAVECVQRDPLQRPDMIRVEAMLRPLLVHT